MHHKRNREPAMSTPFYDLASLVVVPSGYKSGKIYAQKPLTTDGQLTFTRASTATRVNASGLIETVASNVPRLDYTNSTCPKLLLEPQRTNLSTFSEQLDNTAGWTKQSTLVTANATTSPDGTTNADKLIATAANTFHAIFNFNGVLTGNHTLTFYAKKAEYDFIVAHDQFSSRFLSVFNLNTGAVVSGSNSSIEAVGNGWYRCVVRFDGAGATVIFSLSPSPTSSAGTNYLGDGTSGVFVWGTQLEAGAYATSYIPTTTQVTRLADAAVKTGISSLIGQTEGTLFADVQLDARVNYAYFAIAPNLGSASTYIGFSFEATRINFEVVNSGLQVSIAQNTTATGRFKVAFAYKANDFVAYVNGVQVATDTSGTIPACSQLSLSAYSDAQALKYSQALLFTTSLTNAQLAELTTL